MRLRRSAAIAALLVAGAARGTEAGSPDAAAGACTPVAGSVTLEEMGRAPDRSGLSAASSLQAVWTGSEALVWASWTESRPLDVPRFAELDGFFAYAPQTRAWRAFPSKGLPHLRRPAFVWAAGRAILWGGINGSTITGEGVIFDPATGLSQPTSPRNAPLGRQYHTAIAVGDRMLVFGGGGVGGVNAWSCDGALLDPVLNTWRALPPAPQELCAWSMGARIVAASAERAVVLFAEPAQTPRFRAAFYDVAKSAWSTSATFAPARRVTFNDAGAIGPDGALYLVGTGAFPARAATVFRVREAPGGFEPVAPACEEGPIVRAGDRLRVIGSAGATCEIDVARAQCMLPMRGVGFPSAWARQFSVAAGNVFLVWGHGAGTAIRWGPAAEEAPAAARPNVRGAVITATRPHCGGVQPPPWEPRIAETPARSFRLLIRRGTRNVDPKVVAEVATDADGLFEATLPPGSYCAVGAGQREVKLKLPKTTDAATARCLAEQNAGCLATFQVPPAGGAPVPVVIRIPNACFGPCFHGSPPP